MIGVHAAERVDKRAPIHFHSGRYDMAITEDRNVFTLPPLPWGEAIAADVDEAEALLTTEEVEWPDPPPLVAVVGGPALPFDQAASSADPSDLVAHPRISGGRIEASLGLVDPDAHGLPAGYVSFSASLCASLQLRSARFEIRVNGLQIASDHDDDLENESEDESDVVPPERISRVLLLGALSSWMMQSIHSLSHQRKDIVGFLIVVTVDDQWIRDHTLSERLDYWDSGRPWQVEGPCEGRFLIVATDEARLQERS